MINAADVVSVRKWEVRITSVSLFPPKLNRLTDTKIAAPKLLILIIGFCNFGFVEQKSSSFLPFITNFRSVCLEEKLNEMSR